MKTQTAHTYFNQLLRTKPALLAIAGVAIAIICSLVVFSEVNPRHDTLPESGVVNAESAITHGVVKVMDLSVKSFFTELH